MKEYPNFAWLKTPHVWQYLQLYLICDVVQLADILQPLSTGLCQHTHLPLVVVGRPLSELQSDAVLPERQTISPSWIPDPKMACVFAHAVGVASP